MRHVSVLGFGVKRLPMSSVTSTVEESRTLYFAEVWLQESFTRTENLASPPSKHSSRTVYRVGPGFSHCHLPTIRFRRLACWVVSSPPVARPPGSTNSRDRTPGRKERP